MQAKWILGLILIAVIVAFAYSAYLSWFSEDVSFCYQVYCAHLSEEYPKDVDIGCREYFFASSAEVAPPEDYFKRDLSLLGCEPEKRLYFCRDGDNVRVVFMGSCRDRNGIWVVEDGSFSGMPVLQKAPAYLQKLISSATPSEYSIGYSIEAGGQEYGVLMLRPAIHCNKIISLAPFKSFGPSSYAYVDRNADLSVFCIEYDMNTVITVQPIPEQHR